MTVRRHEFFYYTTLLQSACSISGLLFTCFTWVVRSSETFLSKSPAVFCQSASQSQLTFMIPVKVLSHRNRRRAAPHAATCVPNPV